MPVAGSCVAFDNRGLLILGRPGSGKSRLVADCLAIGAALVADDQVVVTAADGSLQAAPPATIAGKLSIRDFGLLSLPFVSSVELVGAVEIGLPIAANEWRFGGVSVPLWRTDSPRPSLVKLWLDALDPAMPAIRLLPDDWHPKAVAS